MKISIFASIGAQNLGDELILKNEIKLFENKYGKDTRFFVFSYDPKNPFFKQKNIKYISYFPQGIKKLKNILKNILNFFNFLKIVIKSDLIILGGGGIIYDMEKQITKNPLKQWVFRTNIFKFFRKKFTFFAVGINIKNEINLSKVKKIFTNAKNISVRDKYSFNLLKKLGIKSSLIIDPVFYDNGNCDNINTKHNTFLINRYDSKKFSFKDLENTPGKKSSWGIDFAGKTVGIAFRGGYLNNNDSKLNTRIEEGKINEIINLILKKGGKIILLPHSFHNNDIIANDYLFLKKFVNNKKNILICESIEQVYEIYISKKIDICLSMRLHSMILSQVYGIPFVGISYSTKTDEVLNTIEKNYEK